MGLRKSLVEVGKEGNGFKDREVVVGFAHTLRGWTNQSGYTP